MQRIPFAELATERSVMLRRLKAQPVPDAALHERAITEMERRLDTWWGGPLPPLSSYDESPPTKLPVVITAHPIELLIVRAISPAREPAAFGISSNGAPYVMDTEVGYQVFVTGLSPVLDQTSDICRHESPWICRRLRLLDFDQELVAP